MCNDFDRTSRKLISVCNDNSKELCCIVYDAQTKINHLQSECEKIKKWIINEYSAFTNYDEDVFYTRFESIIYEINDCKRPFFYTFHISDVTKVLNKLSAFDYYCLLEVIKESIEKKSIVFLGDPGTGKTQGVTAFSDELIKQEFHYPIVVQARNIPESENWGEIVLHTLRLANKWDEDELWQGLISSVNRNRFKKDILDNSIALCPKILIIIDGLDESSSQQKWIDRIKETTVITDKYPQIRFCFTSRPNVFPRSVEYTNIIRLNSAGDVPAFKLFDEYTKAYDVTVNRCQWLKYALNTPLALRLFCELHKGQRVSISQLSEVSLEQLWRKKIEKIQTEFNIKEGLSEKDQRAFLTIVALSKCFLDAKYVDRNDLIRAITDQTGIKADDSEKVIDYLESYGVVGSFCEKGKGLSADQYVYYPGIQGYFDYAEAIHLLELYGCPADIDFKEQNNVSKNVLYSLSVISIQKYDYVLTNNLTITDAFYCNELEEILFYSLQHSDPNKAVKYKERLLEIMSEGADPLVTVTNNLILPLSRIHQHPLGVSLLDDYLNRFEKPAQRDIVWSLPLYLKNSSGKNWSKNSNVSIIDDADEEYGLTSDDLYDDLPIVYVWMLSNVSNDIRNKCRDELMKWARMVPKQYFKLFLHFSGVNDPQIRSDLFSILMCIVYEGASDELIKEISAWIITNNLDVSQIDKNRDASVRYYSIVILLKAKIIGLYTDEELKKFLPPYYIKNADIELSKDAFSGTRMEGFSAITYDLSRYVLVDHFDYDFNSYKYKQLNNFIISSSKENEMLSGINSEQFILSAAYAFILQMGWNEEEFYNMCKDESGELKVGIDRSIKATYYPATHGAQSKVMTVCEKYVWAARHYLDGFLSDRLLFGDEQIKITDYSILDNFAIPAQEMKQIDPENVPVERPWYVPESDAVSIDKNIESKEDIKDYIQKAPDITWERWIKVDNEKRLFEVQNSDLLALEMYACFYDPAGIDTSLFIESILVKSEDTPKFFMRIHDKEVFNKVCDPTRWVGGPETTCYISPKEVCWFTWKKEYESYYNEEFPEILILPAVDYCCYDSTQYGESHYYLPAKMLRNLLGIVDTDGYLYFNKDKNVIAEYSIAGEKWRTSQQYVLVGAEDTLNSLNEKGYTLIWIMQELRRETANSQEKYGEFYAERRQYYIGYYDNNSFIVEKLKTSYLPKE